MLSRKVKANNPSVFLSLLVFVTLIITLPAPQTSVFAQEENIVRGVIDIHSKISDGKYTQEKIAQSARGKGIKILIFGESALRKWEYGLWPLRNIIKKTYQENSVLRLGVRKYLEKFSSLKKEFPDLVLIPGVEASPFYYWEGSPCSGNIALVDYYKQFLIVGLSKDYQNMPVVGNRQFSCLSKNVFFGLWPVLLIMLGLRLLRKKMLGGSLILAGILFLMNNLPFPASRFNVYQGYQGAKPYQDLIDYVNKKGGLIFWGHPEVFSQKRYFGIEVCTLMHADDLFLTHDYTGFGLIYKDRCDVVEPGDIWDQLLLEYIEGKRKKPVWIIGTPHYTGEAASMDSVETVFFLKDIKEQDILDALRHGRMYVRFNLEDDPVILNEFSAKRIGPSSIQISIKGSWIPDNEPLKIELIRNGEVFREFEETGSRWEVITEDNLQPGKSGAYYRLKITARASIIYSNPIFVEAGK